MSKQREAAFITEAKSRFAAGKPERALEMLYRFSDIVEMAEKFPTAEYWQLRAAGEFLSGNGTEGESALKESGGVSLKFLELYRNAFSAFAARPLPRMKRGRIAHEGLIRYNIGQIIRYAQEVGGDGFGLGQDLAEIVPRKR